jgi:hypothetical protein
LVFRFYEDREGKRVHRNQRIGTVREYRPDFDEQFVRLRGVGFDVGEMVVANEGQLFGDGSSPEQDRNDNPGAEADVWGDVEDGGLRCRTRAWDFLWG